MNQEYDDEYLKAEDECNIVDNKCLTHRTCEGAQKEISKIHSLRKNLLDSELKQRELLKALSELGELINKIKEEK